MVSILSPVLTKSLDGMSLAKNQGTKVMFMLLQEANAIHETLQWALRLNS